VMIVVDAENDLSRNNGKIVNVTRDFIL
jgi:hypothetical protein